MCRIVGFSLNTDSRKLPKSDSRWHEPSITFNSEWVRWNVYIAMAIIMAIIYWFKKWDSTMQKWLLYYIEVRRTQKHISETQKVKSNSLLVFKFSRQRHKQLCSLCAGLSRQQVNRHRGIGEENNTKKQERAKQMFVQAKDGWKTDVV